MADEKAKIVTDATGPGSGPAPAQPEAAAQVPKQEQPAPEVLAPDKAEAPAQEAPVSQDKAADAPKEQKAASREEHFCYFESMPYRTSNALCREVMDSFFFSWVASAYTSIVVEISA